jgi:hypothetical protein
MTGIVVEFVNARFGQTTSESTSSAVNAELLQLIAVANAVISAYVGWDGICNACLEDSTRLAPVPCESARWGMAVLIAYGDAQAWPSVGTEGEP